MITSGTTAVQHLLGSLPGDFLAGDPAKPKPASAYKIVGQST
jgi:hypothetical protein